jgi:hypothetical protein
LREWDIDAETYGKSLAKQRERWSKVAGMKRAACANAQESTCTWLWRALWMEQRQGWAHPKRGGREKPEYRGAAEGL